MRPSLTKCIAIAAALLILLSSIALGVNYYFIHYPGNNYIPPNIELTVLILILIYSGLLLQFRRNFRLTRIFKEITFYYLVLCVLAYATNAAQYTPFPTIDQKIVAFESYFHIHLEKWLDWTHQYPLFVAILTWMYESLAYQMAAIPLIVIAAGKYHILRQYLFLLLASALFGFSIYYFFPTTAPASIIESPHFIEEQKATGIKFFEIHHHIEPSTIEGGMIALPSFHVIWAWLCVYLLHPWKIAFALILIANTILVLSCVLLGWHYLSDVLASIVILLIAHYLLRICQKHHNNS